MPNRDDEVAARLRRAAQDDLPVLLDPFRAIADKHGVAEQELLETLREWLHTGVIRRYGALVNHRKLGFAYNALVAWQVMPERIEGVGRLLADDSDVTHCYERTPVPQFPFNLYTMIHTHSEQECRRKVEHLANMVGIARYEILVSTREFKKSSPTYGSLPDPESPPEKGTTDE